MGRTSKWLFLTVVVGLTSWMGHPRAQGPTTQFLGIGDLPNGGVNSIVQEATQVGSTIYAVGASTQTATNTPIPNLDTAVVWDSATSTLTIVPDLVTFSPMPTSSNSVLYAVTPDAQYIAGRLRSVATNSGLSNGIRALRAGGGLRSIPGFTALDISRLICGWHVARCGASTLVFTAQTTFEAKPLL